MKIDLPFWIDIIIRKQKGSDYCGDSLLAVNNQVYGVRCLINGYWAKRILFLSLKGLAFFSQKRRLPMGYPR